jgi:hypothetical protein
VGGRQLKHPGTLHLCQHIAENLLPVVVPRQGSCGRSMRGCALMDQLGAQVVCRPWLFLGCYGEDVLDKFSR